MALDGIFLRHIKNEIENEALGARVSQVTNQTVTSVLRCAPLEK